MNLRSFFHQLRDRRVLRALAAYAVAAFIVVQVADLTFGPLGIPAWGLTFVVVLSLLGLPVVAAVSWAFDWSDGRLARAGSGDTGTRPVSGGSRVPGSGRRAPLAVLVLAVAVVAVGATVLLLPGGRGERGEVDPDAVVILPFDVSSPDGSLDYLRDGLVVLLASTLSGEGGVRAVDPRASLAPFRAGTEGGGAEPPDGERLAARLGAGRWLTGEVVGRAEGLVLTGRMWTTGGKERASASVEGGADSLPKLVERLAIELLGREAGIGNERITGLQRAPLEAVKEYLEGQRAAWTGEYVEANQRFSRALEADSTFALAALGLVQSTGWAVDLGLRDRGMRLAWAGREHLSARDRAVLEAAAGPEYPNVSSARAVLAAAEQALRLAPDRPESVFLVGDHLFHSGAWLGIRDHLERAERLFRRAGELDPTFASPIQHLMEVALLREDTAGAVAWARRYIEVNAEGDRVDYARWLADAVSGALDTVDVAARAAAMSNPSLQHAIYAMAQTGVGGAHLESLLRADRARAATEAQSRNVAWRAFYTGHNTGRPAAWSDVGEVDRPRLALRAALHWGGDTIAAAEGLRELTERSRPIVKPDGSFDGPAFWDRLELELWRLHHGDTTSLRAWRSEVAALHPVPADWQPMTVFGFRLTTSLVEAVAERVEGGSRNRHPRLDALDSILDEAPPPLRGAFDGTAFRGAVISSWLHDAYGEHAQALAAARRQVVFASNPFYRSTLLREEGRLAALAGDREGAIQAYRRFLALRRHAEGPAAAETEQVRRALAALVGEG